MWALLAAGVGVASLSAILVRYAPGAEPLAISFWRCACGAALLAPFAGRRLGTARGSSVRVSAVAGVFLAVHFATWITSLELTTVAASVLLVSTTPIFVALAARGVLSEHLSRSGWTGIALALAGSAGIAAGAGNGGAGEGSLLGNGLALAGGVTAAGYVLGGRLARRDLGALEYSLIAYAVAAVGLLGACIVARVPLWGYPAGTWWAIAAIVVGPQMLGHTVINLVLSDIDATTVSVAIMAEPVIATALAFVLFSEVPSLAVYPGGALILLGIYLVSVRGRVAPLGLP